MITQINLKAVMMSCTKMKPHTKLILPEGILKLSVCNKSISDTLENVMMNKTDKTKLTQTKYDRLMKNMHSKQKILKHSMINRFKRRIYKLRKDNKTIMKIQKNGVLKRHKWKADSIRN